jgi:hypothetical protein
MCFRKMHKMIRLFEESDLELIKRVWEKYYQNEFEFPDLTKFLTLFATSDDHNNLISVGGVRPIYEIVAITDKEYSPFVRRSAFFNLLTACIYTVKGHDIDQLHAFTQGEKWTEAVKKMGFVPTKGNALVLNID